MPTSAQNLSDVTCPFCGLACDDLTLTHSAQGLRVTKNGCEIASASFRKLGSLESQKATPRVAGKEANFADAIAAAARILSEAKAPLIAGFGTDVGGARATLALADRIGAVVDHMNMPAKIRNILTVQNSGWITTTLAEIKNRADFILVIGNGAVKRFPRFLERAVWPNDAMFAALAERKVVFLGEVDSLDIATPKPFTRLHCRHSSLSRIVPALRAIVNGQPIGDGQFAPSDIKTLQDLAAQMWQARYGVIVWAASDFDFSHGELTIQTLAEMIKDLNKTIRFAGFPLGGSDGDFSGNGAQTWQTGLPLRSRYGKSGLDYDPYRYGANELLAANEADSLLWISSFDVTRTPPNSTTPTIVLGPSTMVFQREPDVFIPVGTPGIHHGGHFVRADKVVIMRLKKLLTNELPSVADAINAIHKQVA
jgi:formylmethanofuran dehydrogenase subunit B